MSYYGYNPYQPNGNKMNREQISRYGSSRVPPVKHTEPTGRYSNAVSGVNWFFTILLTAIPVINFIVCLFWAGSKSMAPSKINYAKACLWLNIIFVIIPALVFGIIYFASPILFQEISGWILQLLAKVHVYIK